MLDLLRLYTSASNGDGCIHFQHPFRRRHKGRGAGQSSPDGKDGLLRHHEMAIIMKQKERRYVRLDPQEVPQCSLGPPVRVMAVMVNRKVAAESFSVLLRRFMSTM